MALKVNLPPPLFKIRLKEDRLGARVILIWDSIRPYSFRVIPISLIQYSIFSIQSYSVFSCIHSFIHLYSVFSCIHSFICIQYSVAFIHAFFHSFVFSIQLHSFIHLSSVFSNQLHSFMHSFIHLSSVFSIHALLFSTVASIFYLLDLGRIVNSKLIVEVPPKQVRVGIL